MALARIVSPSVPFFFFIPLFAGVRLGGDLADARASTRPAGIYLSRYVCMCVLYVRIREPAGPCRTDGHTLACTYSSHSDAAEQAFVLWRAACGSVLFSRLGGGGGLGFAPTYLHRHLYNYTGSICSALRIYIEYLQSDIPLGAVLVDAAGISGFAAWGGCCGCYRYFRRMHGRVTMYPSVEISK